MSNDFNLQWLNIGATILAAVIGAIGAYLIGLLSRKRITYGNVTIKQFVPAETISQHKIQIKYGDYIITDRASILQFRVKNSGASSLEKVHVRITSKNPKTVKIINVLAKGATSLIEERIQQPTGNQETVSLLVANLPLRAHLDIETVLETNLELTSIENVISIEIEADGIMGTYSSSERFLYTLIRYIEKFINA
jgi:hypothetical protein